MTHEVVIVEAVRSPLGKRNGGLSRVHPADLLGAVLAACVERAGIDSSDVEQLVGGCVEQVGEQAGNVTRAAWLDVGLAENTAAISLDSACGSSQQAVGIAASLIASGAVDVAMASGLASMSRLPIATSFTSAFEPSPTERTLVSDHGPRYGTLFEKYGFGQFGCAEVLAERYGVTRADADGFGLRSQQRAIAAWDAGRFDAEVIPIRAFDADEPVRRDEGLRDSTLDKLATLKPVANANGVHTAASSSQISDGAAAVLLMSAQRAAELGLRPRARIVDHCHVGVDPVVMLEGPVAATERLLSRNKLTVGDIDLYEVNEAFASVPLMWQRRFDADGDRLNPNGGAIALGHPIGATGARLITTALHELERSDKSLALVTMCAGGGLGTGTLIERL